MSKARWWVILLWSVCFTAQRPLVAQESGNYKLDLGHTFVHWEVLHMGTSTIRGRFDRLQGQVVFDPLAQRLEVGITVDMASVSSGAPAFDAVLRSPTLLSTQDHPQAFFSASRARWEGEVPREVRGEIMLRGISRPLTLNVVRWKCAFNPLFRARVCGGDLEAKLLRTDFDLHFGSPMVADEVLLRIQVEAIPTPP